MSLKSFAPNLGNATSLGGIARALGISTPLFQEVVDCRNPQDFYRLHRIPKRVQPKREPIFVQIDGMRVQRIGGVDLDYRLVWESISPSLKLAHKSAAFYIDLFLRNSVRGYPHPNAYGYVRGRSTRDHADRHKGASRIVSADIKNFFPSITIGRIDAGLRSAGLSRDAASLLAKFLTIEDRLPQGLNASPLLANYLALPLDIEFTALADSRGLTYTRYADDLTFSGVDNLPELEEIQGILAGRGFEINKRKYRRSKRGQKHFVTGLSVADDRAPHVPKRMKRRLRQELFYIRKYGLNNHIATLKGAPSRQHTVNRIEGMLSYVTSVERALSKRLLPAWVVICEAEEMEKSFSPRPFVHLRDANWYVDEIELKFPDGRRSLAVLCVEVHDTPTAQQNIQRFAATEAEDCYVGADAVKNLRRGCVHWADLTMSQKTRFVEVLAALSFRCRIAISPAGFDEDYEATYIGLLSHLVDSMLRSADDADVGITVEANSSKVSGAQIPLAIRSAYDKLVESNERRPVAAPSVSIVKKGESPLVSVADALLGIADGYLSFADSKPTEEFRFFKRLEPRFALVLDFAREAVFHRKNPLQPWIPLR